VRPLWAAASTSETCRQKLVVEVCEKELESAAMKETAKKIGIWTTTAATVLVAAYQVYQARSEAHDSQVNVEASYAATAPVVKEVQVQIQMLTKWAEAHGKDFDKFQDRNIEHGEKIAKYDVLFDFLKERNSGLERVNERAERGIGSGHGSGAGFGRMSGGGIRRGSSRPVVPHDEGSAEPLFPIAPVAAKKARPPKMKMLKKMPETLKDAQQAYQQQLMTK